MIRKFEGKDGQHYFSVVAANGEVVAQSEGYVSEYGRDKGARAMRRALDTEQEEEETMSLNDLLEKRHSEKLKWEDPVEAAGPDGKAVSAHVTMSATVHDCVNMQRLKWSSAGQDHAGKDMDLLMEFIAVNWAMSVRK